MLPDKVWICYTTGGFYKSPTPYSKNDMEKPCITVEFLAALTAEPTPLIDVETKVVRMQNEKADPGYTKIPDVDV